MWSPLKADVERLKALFQYRNISRASEALGMTQPQLSKDLARMEHELGAKMFVRRPQGLELSQEGERLREKIKKLDLFWEQLSEVQTEEKGPHGNISLGFHPTIGMRFFPMVLHPITEKYPALHLQTSLMPSLEISQEVRNLRLDLGIVINAIKSPELVVRKLATEFVGVWGAGSGEGKVLYYHPDMYQVQRALKKFKGVKRVAISDYEIIGETLALQPNAVGILPNPVAERHGLKSIGGKLFEVQLSLIAHKERLEQRNIKAMFLEIQRQIGS